MCVYSMVSDHYMHKWPLPAYVPNYEDYLNYKELLRKAAEYDRITGQKDCPSQEKTDWNKQLDEAFRKKYDGTYGFTATSVFNAKDFTRNKMDLWCLWPDTYMCPQDEIEENLQWRSDDYELVNVISYDKTSSPLSWEKYGTSS